MKYLVFVLALGFLAGCEEQPPRDLEFQVGGEKFVVSTAKVDGTGSYLPKYQRLNFEINVETFEPQITDYPKQKKKAIFITIGPPWAMDGNYNHEVQYNWTDRDKYLKATPLSCEEQIYEGEKYRICDLGKNVENLSAPNFYSLVKNENSEVITILRCSRRYKAPNPLCVNRSRLFDNIHIQYYYNVSNFNRAIEIDQKVKEYVLQFHKPLEKESTQ